MQIEDACKIFVPILKYYAIYLQILVPSGNGDRFEVNERELQSVLGDPEIQDRKVSGIVKSECVLVSTCSSSTSNVPYEKLSGFRFLKSETKKLRIMTFLVDHTVF